MNSTFQSGEAGVCGTANVDQLWGAVSKFARGSPAEWWATIQSVCISAVRRQYLHNDYFVGGLGLMIIGLLSRHSWEYCTLLYNFLTKSHGVFSVYVETEDHAFVWIQEWLSDKASKDSTQLTLKAKWHVQPLEDDPITYVDSPLGPRPHLYYVPELLEVQALEFQGEMVTFQLQRKSIGPSMESDSGGNLAALLQSASKEQLVIGGPTRQILERVVQEAMDSYYSKQEVLKQTVVQRWHARDNCWIHVAQRVARPIGSVILDCDVSALVADARQFLSSRSWYNDRGIPHRRGYILYGPPGCGKSSFIQALAGEFGLDVAMVGLSSREMNDDMVHSAMNKCDTRSILVLEDVDAAFTQRADGEGKTNALSFSGLLNALDGISAQEGRLLIMTTNHLEKLDPALIRPGRIDFRLYLGLTSRSQVVRLFKRFHPESTEEQSEKFGDSIPEHTISPASIQGYLLMHRDDPQGSVDHIEDLLKQQEEEEKRQRLGEGGSATPPTVTSDEECCRLTSSHRLAK